MAQPFGTSMYDALSGVRNRLAGLDFPFLSASAAETRRAVDGIVELLDHYVLPRLAQPDAPMLVAVGGSTGAGKSTLVSTLAGEVVAVPGVLRPTTRTPVLAHHPEDSPWFPNDRVQVERHRASKLPRGIVLLDTPPIDSVSGESGATGVASLEAADVWVFMTTAARYADAVAWDVLARGAERQASVAVVVNRVPPHAVGEVRSHLAGLLAARGLGDSPLFAVEETTLDSAGMLPSGIVEPVARWLEGLAADDDARAAAIQRTVDGAIDHVVRRVSAVLAQAEVDVFDEAVRTELGDAVTDVRRARGAAG